MLKISVNSYVKNFVYITLFLQVSRLQIVAAEGNGNGVESLPQEMLIVGNSVPLVNYYQPVYTPAGYFTPFVKPIYQLPPSYVKPVVESQYTLTNLTTNVGRSLEVPFGERMTVALSFPPMDERRYNKDHSQEFKVDDEPTTNIGTVIVDTFVLKERGVDVHSQTPPRPNAAILGGILKNVLTESSPKKQSAGEDEPIHLPGQLISMEIPLSGSPDYSGLNNLTEFLIDETSKMRPRKSHLKEGREQAPMFVALQFHTVGRHKVRSYDEGAEKKVAIHVVLGHKHFEFKNVHQLNRLYEYVKPEYYIYKPIYGLPEYYTPVVIQNVLIPEESKFYISKATVDLIIEFVEYTWDIHKKTYDETKARGKIIAERLVALIQRNLNQGKNSEESKFRPERPWQQPDVDFFTWPYTNTLAFRTLAM